MPFAAAVSTDSDASLAVAEAADRVAEGLPSPQLICAFVSPHHATAAGQIASQLAARFPAAVLVGCGGESIVATGREIENDPAISLWAGSFGDGAHIDAFHLQPTDTPDGISLLGWPDALDDCDPKRDLLLTFADPYTFPITDLFFPRLREDYPGLAVVGGMSSGADGPGQAVLFHGGETVPFGAVGVLLRGVAGWRTVVSQGCRPIGRPLVVTKARENVILEVGGQAPVRYLHDLFETLPERDKELFQRGLHIGLVTNEYLESFDRGDFLIRNLYAIDRQTGALVVTDRVRVGQTVQFQLRDATTADDDLRSLLRADRAKHPPAAGALLFTCNGRGTRLFPEPDHDAKALAEELGPIPNAGFFAAGELGPVGGTNHIHGFTASSVLFSDGV